MTAKESPHPLENRVASKSFDSMSGFRPEFRDAG
jgi:hypothetical protein